MRRKLAVIALVLMMMLGFGILLYPALSDFLARRNQIKTIQNMHRAVEQYSDGELELKKNRAEEYNRSLQDVQIGDMFESADDEENRDIYNGILDFGEGVMAELDIPCINVNLPVYHGTDEEVLGKGIGHLYKSSFPVGGEGFHAVLTGHTGLPNMELLTDLEEMKMGDCFYIKILNYTLAYEVDQILVKEPYDTSELQPVSGKDYVTLVTCTPYGINTHRLLVRGVRIPYQQGDESDGGYAVDKIFESGALGWYIIGIVIGVICLIIIIILIIVFKKDREGRSET